MVQMHLNDFDKLLTTGITLNIKLTRTNELEITQVNEKEPSLEPVQHKTKMEMVQTLKTNAKKLAQVPTTGQLKREERQKIVYKQRIIKPQNTVYQILPHVDLQYKVCDGFVMCKSGHGKDKVCEIKIEDIPQIKKMDQEARKQYMNRHITTAKQKSFITFFECIDNSRINIEV